jgi:hypothetical protein
MRRKEYEDCLRRIAELAKRIGGVATGAVSAITQLVGDVVAGPGSGVQTATIPNNTVSNAKLADMAQATFKMRAAGAGTGDPIDGTPDQASAVLDLATDPLTRKSYVDALAVNLGKRARVRAATIAPITISTALNNGDSLDGVTLATGDLVLVKDQSSAAENGVYVVGASPARSSEFDTYDEYPGTLIAVEEGSTNADTLWLCTSNVGGTLNTTAIVFSQLTVSAGAPSSAQYVVLALDGGLSAERRLVAGANITLTDGGPNADVTIAATGGGGTVAYPDFTAPVTGDFAWINQGGATVAVDTWQGATSNYLEVPASSGNNARIRKKTAPAPPYVITAAFLVNWLSVDYESFGLIFRQSSDGKLHTCGLATGAAITQLFSQKWNSPSSFNTTYAQISRFVNMVPIWFRIADNNTNRIFSVSGDGHNWNVFDSVGRTDFLTADEVGWFGDTSNTINALGVTLLSWSQS